MKMRMKMLWTRLKTIHWQCPCICIMAHASALAAKQHCAFADHHTAPWTICTCILRLVYWPPGISWSYTSAEVDFMSDSYGRYSALVASQKMFRSARCSGWMPVSFSVPAMSILPVRCWPQGGCPNPLIRCSIKGKKLESHEAAVEVHSNVREGEAMFGNNTPC